MDGETRCYNGMKDVERENSLISSDYKVYEKSEAEKRVEGVVSRVKDWEGGVERPALVLIRGGVRYLRVTRWEV